MEIAELIQIEITEMFEILCNAQTLLIKGNRDLKSNELSVFWIRFGGFYKYGSS